MNCKPGDLAVVVGRCEISGDYLIGRIFRVTTFYRDDEDVVWEYEGPRLETPWGELLAVADDNLRPIRDPGDDATDETLLWKPVPVTEKEPA